MQSSKTNKIKLALSLAQLSPSLLENVAKICLQVTYAFCKEFASLLTKLVTPEGDLPVVQILSNIFEQSSKAASVSKAFHRYALNYINALNYLETLRRHHEFSEFEKVSHANHAASLLVMR